MTIVPKIMINPIKFDFQNGLSIDWDIEIDRIDKTGFFYKITTNSS
jgi:hypothetical protein